MNECEFPKKANLGCGYDVRPGYLNIDLHVWHNPDLVADVTKLDMLPSGYFEEVVAQDVLEHLERHKVGPALAEWARILAGGGALYVRVPSLMGMFNMLKQPENWPCEEAEKIVHLMYGTQAYTGDYHLSGFTAPMLNTYLNRAGLRVVQANIMDGWLFDIKAKKTDNMTDLEFVHEAYFRLFGRPASEHEVEYHDCLLSSGKSSRADLECALVIGRNEMFQKMRQGNEVEYDQAGIDAIRNSTSWKITAPLRSFVSMLRKLGN
jgi:predicted SAM-dependent methyltransferase